jgi:hypothetical protein
LARIARASAGLAFMSASAAVSASIQALMAGPLARAHLPSEIQNGNSTSSPAARSGSPSDTLPAASSAPVNGSSASTASTLPALSWSPMFGNGTSTPRIELGSTPFFFSQ